MENCTEGGFSYICENRGGKSLYMGNTQGKKSNKFNFFTQSTKTTSFWLGVILSLKKYLTKKWTENCMEGGFS